MGLIAKNKGGGNFELVPEDQHVARCVRVIDIGTQESSYGLKHQCVIAWELPENQQVYDKDKGPEPSLMSKFFTLSLNEKSNLRGMLESWRGRAFTEQELEGFDLRNLIGVPCLLQVIHNTNAKGDKRAVIKNVSKMPKSMVCPPQILDSLIFTLEESGQEEFNCIPEWQQQQIMKCSEWEGFFARVNRTSTHSNSAGISDSYNFEADAEPSDEVPF